MFKQLTILAPGLLGASVARAAKQRGLAQRIHLWSRRLETRLQLREQTWCDAVAETPEEACAGASLVVLAAPVDSIPALASQIAGCLSAGTLVTDVGSTKADLVRRCQAALRADTPFVGAHPMAGSDKTGWEHSSAELFQDRACFITPVEATQDGAATQVAAFWKALGLRIFYLNPDQHDEVVALVSHLPQVLASTLCAYLASKDLAWRNYAGQGLRDTTRIAGSDPAMWKAILEHNRDEILRALLGYQEQLQHFASALANRDYAELGRQLEQGRLYRKDL